MGLEVASYIADLVATNPVSSDQVGQGDDHLRLLKSVLQATFPNLGGQYSHLISCSAGVTLASTDNTALVNVPVATGATITHTASLPTIGSVTAGFYMDFAVPGPTDVVILDPAGAGTIEGSATLTIGPRVFARVYSDGTTWRCAQLPILSSGGIAIAGTTTLSGAVVLNSTLSVEGAATISGATVLKTTLNVEGASSFSGAATFNSVLNVDAGQLQFPAAQNSSSDVNCLDDYEEGTFSPTLTFGTPGDLAVTYAVRSGLYTKIGDEVVVTIRVSTSVFTHSTASGTLKITGLPFAAATVANHITVANVGEATGVAAGAGQTYLSAQLLSNTSELLITTTAAATGVTQFITVSTAASGVQKDIQLTIKYKAAT